MEDINPDRLQELFSLHLFLLLLREVRKKSLRDAVGTGVGVGGAGDVCATGDVVKRTERRSRNRGDTRTSVFRLEQSFGRGTSRWARKKS